MILNVLPMLFAPGVVTSGNLTLAQMVVLAMAAAGGLFMMGIFFVTFRITIFKPRGKDLQITHQVENVEAPDPASATRKAYQSLPAEYKDPKRASVDGVHTRRKGSGEDKLP